MTQEEKGIVLEALTAISFFPKAPAAQAVIANDIAAICGTVQSGLWLATRAVELHQTWDTCGLPGLHQIWFSAHRPKNEHESGLAVTSGSTKAYPDGTPPGPLPPNCGCLSCVKRSKRLQIAAGRTALQIEGESEPIQLPAPEVEELHAETIGRLLAVQPAISPTRRDRLDAQRVGAMLDGDMKKAERIAAMLHGTDPRSPEDRRAIAEAEREIAAAKPTRTAEESKRLVDELAAKLAVRGAT